MDQTAPQTTAPAVDADEKFFAALGYFGFLFVIPLVVKPKSAYCKFHAKQSMVLFITFFIAMVLLLSIRTVGSLVMLALFAVYVLAIYRAYTGEMWQIPFVSTFAGKIDVESLYNKAGMAAVSGLSNARDAASKLASKAGEAAQKMGDQEEPKKE